MAGRAHQKCSTEKVGCDLFPKQMQLEEPEFQTIAEEAPPQNYQAFLHSRRWAEIKALVMKQCGGVCEACMRKPASIVHHLTMKYGFSPPLWCLRGVCRSCHARFRERFASGDRRARRDDWLGKNGRSY